MNSQYCVEFKPEAVKRLEKSGEPLTKVAADLGVKPTTMLGWANKYKNSTITQKSNERSIKN